MSLWEELWELGQYTLGIAVVAAFFLCAIETHPSPLLPYNDAIYDSSTGHQGFIPGSVVDGSGQVGTVFVQEGD